MRLYIVVDVLNQLVLALAFVILGKIFYVIDLLRRRRHGVVFRFFNNSLQKQAAEIYSEAGDACAEITLEPCEYKTYLLKERKWRETADDGELL